MLFSPILLDFLSQESYSWFPAMLLLSTLHTHASLPTSSQNTLTSFGHTYLMSMVFSLLKTSVCQHGHFMPKSRVSYITAPAGPLTCFPHLNLLNLPHPSFILFAPPLSSPNSCPILSGPGGKLFLLHEKRQGGRALFARSGCHLSPQFHPFCGSHPCCMRSPRPCWHHACT